jgi:hypothetical protein
MGLDNYPVLEKKIDEASGGDHIIIAGLPGQTIRVFRIFIVLGSDTDVTFKDGATALTGPLPMLANGSITLDFTELHWFLTSPGNDFVINTTPNASFAGRVYYTQSTPA